MKSSGSGRWRWRRENRQHDEHVFILRIGWRLERPEPSAPLISTPSLCTGQLAEDR
jgi:hypothetical protein